MANLICYNTNLNSNLNYYRIIVTVAGRRWAARHWADRQIDSIHYVIEYSKDRSGSIDRTELEELPSRIRDRF